MIYVFYPGKSIDQDTEDPLIRYAGIQAILSVTKVTNQTFEITLAPLPSITSNAPAPVPETGLLIDYNRQILFERRSVVYPFYINLSRYSINYLRSPLRAIFRNKSKELVQEISWYQDETGSFEVTAEGGTF